jgi:predicted nucleotidyltransferase
MAAQEKDLRIAAKFKQRLQKHDISVVKTIVFGSRARGDADRESDLDILVVVQDKTLETERTIGTCAWEVGFEEEMIIQPVTITTQHLQGPEKASLLMLAINKEGVLV